MNGEAFGGVTDSFIRMGLQNRNTYGKLLFVHPTFLYESLWNLLGVLLVYIFAKKIGKKYDGQLILLTFGWYGLGRMFIEGLRTDSLYLGNTNIRISQLLAGIIFFVFLGLLIFFAIKKPNKPLYMKEAPVEGENKTEDELVKKIKALFSKNNKSKVNSDNHSEKDENHEDER